MTSMTPKPALVPQKFPSRQYDTCGTAIYLGPISGGFAVQSAEQATLALSTSDLSYRTNKRPQYRTSGPCYRIQAASVIEQAIVSYRTRISYRTSDP
ncbi:hypothetical protein AVEN_157443-1 [Araneus ventricosus]|uniref:Uncharacterized protein n=1 Tax=Araneus ventricosus TaxID=182803 RepID=A0A4Y2NHK6_ARAVE|nr:hypothetical protein AVEN_157443-1 [Araneus ventricosus]